MREAYYHEDDFCRIELLPLDNLQHCVTQMGEQQAFADAHRSGAGWTDMYVIKAAPSLLSTLGMTAEQLRLALGDALPPYDAVYTGYSTYRVECKNELAFGGDKTETLFASLNDNGIVSHLWCSDSMSQLLLLPLKEQLLLADWGAGFACPLADGDLFARYLQEYELD
ncbi:hypothetical protein CSQ94_18790 [Janthinobacterium sp. BJB312]|uniref:hypothetical protein n=1 Tax=Janthinobacterium sp. BJB426 TaxID=2048010 RepID=UPI000C0D3B04|nr:hypothetical protein [Janthinobacterium sp. BJB426]PHV28037.1 hypothetical protein CSQ93_10715 [Janthinobacterium sp. BJB426]PHV31892.1 hypothetical protein CSQ94_18790 [Janthinobacterium sp. BJB312]